MESQTARDDNHFLEQIKLDDELAFGELFKFYYAPLTGYAHTILQDRESAKEVVQDMFVKFWEKRHDLEINQSAKAYFYRSVYNRCMNVIKHEGVKRNYQAQADKTDGDNGDMLSWELQEQLDAGLEKLPERCRAVFIKAKLEGLKYAEIAEELGISVKTVENQMGKALKILRVHLKDYLVIMLILIFYQS